jgi:DNA polymerase III subunit epsilon
MEEKILRTVIFDTETTDIHPGDICQIAYIVIDNGIKARNYYFEVDHINPSAERVHGLSVERLKELSGGSRFSDYIDEIEKDFSNVDIIAGHNVSFDIKFLREEFKRCGRTFNYAKEFCTMKHFTNICKIKKNDGRYKYPRLEELIKFLNIEDKEIVDKTVSLYNSLENDYHDARFDTVAAYLCLLRAKKMKLLD